MAWRRGRGRILGKPGGIILLGENDNPFGDFAEADILVGPP
jgi:hypothetical protein